MNNIFYSLILIIICGIISLYNKYKFKDFLEISIFIITTFNILLPFSLYIENLFNISSNLIGNFLIIILLYIHILYHDFKSLISLYNSIPQNINLESKDLAISQFHVDMSNNTMCSYCGTPQLNNTPCDDTYILCKNCYNILVNSPCSFSNDTITKKLIIASEKYKMYFEIQLSCSSCIMQITSSSLRHFNYLKEILNNLELTISICNKNLSTLEADIAIYKALLNNII